MGGWLNKIILVIVVLIVVLSVGVISIQDKQIPAGWQSNERPSPSDWVKEEQIKVYEDKVILDVQDAIWAKFTDTNSMDPFIDEKSHAIEITPSNPDSINKGDVISYRTSYATIIHRVIDKGEDEQGVYYIVKGDNNKLADPGKVRFDNVKGVVVAVIY